VSKTWLVAGNIRVIRPFAPFVLKDLAGIQMLKISNANVAKKRIARIRTADCHSEQSDLA